MENDDTKTTPGAQGEILNTPDPQPATGASGTGETPATTTTQPSLEDALRELESAKAALKKANSEAASHRHKANELDKLKAEAEAANLSETEKLQKKLAELQKAHDTVTRQSQERIISYEVRLQAAQMGIVDPDAAAKLLDWSGIEYDDSGTPTNVSDLLKALIKAKPYLAGKAASTTSGGATNPSRSQATESGEITEQYVRDVTSGKIRWQDLTPERRTAILNWQAKNAYRF